ncbi:mechanosensitive ion channel family protein [Hymenobacter saemangeumensis]|uniref:Mechanosensitive ion channel family protein n=1 Tax=Hymenobacter saemangeumensis TaxID=1084522 RepID=A0ABP8HYV9_9BACT
MVDFSMYVPPFMHERLLGNEIVQYVLAALAIVMGAALRRLLSRLLSKGIFQLTKRYTAGVTEDELHSLLIKPLSTIFFLLTLYFAFGLLTYPVPPDAPAGFQPWPVVALHKLFLIAIISTITWVVLRLVDFALLVVQRRTAYTHANHPGTTRLDSQFLPFAKDLLKVLVIILGFMIMLGEVFAVNVTALIGGLGIGGLAVAFAAKESLENLIASFTIFLDQPFGVGDLVKVGEVNGTVEKIGFRSTRLRTAERSYVTVPNKSMIDKPLDNLSLRTARRVGFTLLFDQATTSAQLHAIIDEAVALMKEHALVTADVQMKFNALTPFGKEVTVQYFVETTSYDEYLNVKEDLNYCIIEVVERQGGCFATQRMEKV